jgi:ABC-type transport system involved in multi-copper enzyme maturation permease subunit
MTAVETTVKRAKPGHWQVHWSGLWLIASLELKQRVRSTKWKWVLAAFVALVGAVTLLTTYATSSSMGGDGSGDIVFGLVIFFVLFLGLLVSPTLSATAINGDSREGTLAPLQATALSAADIVLGKLLGSWLASLAFIVCGLPFIGFSYLTSSAPIAAIFTTVLVLALELMVVCALGLGWSALTSRTSASSVLTFFSVATLSVLTLVFFGLSYPLVLKQTEVRVYDSQVWDDQTGYAEECEWRTETWEQAHTEYTWWLLAANPFVIVADAAPSNDDSRRYDYGDQTLLGSVKYAVREARLGPADFENWCYTGDDQVLLPEEQERRDQLANLSAVWPFGVAFHLLLAGGSIALAVRRVSVPYGKLAGGTRVA